MKYWITILFAFSISTSQTNDYVDSTKVRNPSISWKLGLVPGLGQVYNGKYVKAGILASLQSYSIYKLSGYSKKKQIGKRNTYAWWSVGIYVWNILDSYVDAHLSTFPKNGSLIFCDIHSNENNLKNIFQKKVDGPICILIGPEGDFSENERKAIIDHNQTRSISLGKNILKAETAAISAITIVNYYLNLS